MTLPKEPKTSDDTAPPPYEPPSNKAQAIEHAKALREATSGLRTDKKTLIRIIPGVSLNQTQMALLQETYTHLYDRNLEDDIRGHWPSCFKDAILGIIKGPVWSDVNRLSDLVVDPREEMRVFTFCEIIFYRTQDKLRAVKELYEEKYSRPLAEWVRLCCSTDPAQLLVKYLETSRCEDGTDALDTASIRADAQLLHQGFWRKTKDDMETVSNILASSSRERLIALMDEFEAVYGVKLAKYLKEKTTGILLFTLQFLLSWAEDPIQYARDCLVKLWPVRNGAAELSAITHTMVWGHWNRTMFESGKMRLRYTTSSNLREELERGLHGDSFRDLMFKIYDGKY